VNPDYEPLRLPQPQTVSRRMEKPRPVPLVPEVVARREEIARGLLGPLVRLSRSLGEMSDEERRAVFYKLEHEGATDLAGTGLKPVVEPSDRFTLAVPRSNTLDALARKVKDFGTGLLRRGHPPNESLGRLLNVAQGEPTDRLSEAVLQAYDRLVRQEWVVCEIEMISVARSAREQQAELRATTRALDRLFQNGINGNFFEREEIKGTCRAVIRCTGRLFQQLVEGPDWQCRIWWFDARPEFDTFHSRLRGFSVAELAEFEPPSDGAPIVCIVDSGVTSGNPFLRPVTREDLLKSFLSDSPDNPYDEHGHGSGVASLASYYALNIQQGARNSGKVWIAGARVLDAENRHEEGRLFSKVITEVVDFFAPLGVRIFNLSVNILNRHWNAEARRTVPRRSWVARTIDRLSRERDIVFVVSTGNIGPQQVGDWLRNGHSYPAYLRTEDARLLDPAQAALALTAGALAPGTLLVGRDAAGSALAAANQPAPFTRCGPGMAREIKPELVDYGGNYVHDPEVDLVSRNPGTDIVMASHQVTPAIALDVGTSFAAPRIAHKLAVVLSDLEALGLNQVSACLLKAFLVNSADWASLGDEFAAFRDEMEHVEPKHWLMVAGYGLPDCDRATYCDEYSYVAFYQGLLAPDSVAYFDVPVPPGLASGITGTRRLIVTVVHAPEVQRWGLERYLGTTLKWRMFRGDVGREEIVRYMSVEEEDDAERPPRPDELPSALGVNLRSRGIVQHDIIEWRRHERQFSEGNYTLAVAAYKKWARRVAPVPYAVVVRLEDTTRSAQVYSEVQKILAEIEVQSRARTGPV